ncbi:dihydrofolate reductase family protein [Shimia sp. FJ5]|uniref:dihydrofolate reductase family protein n=1 Tax=Shimia sp. FJ5 TaxID=3079054 RepID=UPI0026192E6C|nr:dihydrofolate reductase family protein [Shimia sp. FJ5]MDV4145566.1 dihydrofolate reductase family protein [Shimia sp. FJ5]
MQPIIYDVAVSLDGYICGQDGDISQFAPDGPVVDDYMARLDGYATAIMGRKTYEFGYDFGLRPGDNPYAHMETFVFSQSLRLGDKSQIHVVEDRWSDRIDRLKAKSPGPIYLCGGGEFAGWLLRQGLIDRLVLKRAPCVYGDGVPLFGGQGRPLSLLRTGTTSYEGGYLVERFELGAANSSEPVLVT